MNFVKSVTITNFLQIITKKYIILNSKDSRKNPRAFLLGLRKLRYAYLPGKKGHTMGITTKEITKQTMIKPVPAFT